jgi:hypothetical protein
MLKKFIVDESKWYRGHGHTQSFLYNAGEFCCVGFQCLQAGLELNDIAGKGSINSVYHSFRYDGKLPEMIKSHGDLFYLALLNVNEPEKYAANNSAYVKIYNTNDDAALHDNRRKELLIKYFAEIGVEIVFAPGPLTNFGLEVGSI